ncbi:MAG: DUF6709 family protein [Bacteroidota bacterium]|jgi:hypothetical protein
MKNIVDSYIRRTSRNMLIIYFIVTSLIGIIFVALYFSNQVIFWILTPLLLFLLWKLFNSIYWLIQPSSHPAYKSLERYGIPFEVAGQIENEYRNKNSLVRFPGSIMTENWFFVINIFDFDLIHLDDMLWIYKEVTKHSVNAIPSGTTYRLAIVTRSSKKIVIDSSKNNVNNILQALCERLPWIQAGYSDELKESFKNEPALLIAQIDSRRKEMLRQFNNSIKR